MSTTKNGFNVVLVGRANVGKSTLFNRICETRTAIVSPVSGTTRDVTSCLVDWQGMSFELTDTGGLDLSGLTDIESQVVKQAHKAIKNADLILFVCNAKDGVLPDDTELIRDLRKKQKPIFLVANKADNPRVRENVSTFYKLGIEPVIATSAANGSGLGDLLDEIVNLIPEKQKTKKPEHEISLAIVGKPNSGKSSLLNKLIGENRAIVSPIAHTTRSVNDAYFSFEDTTFRIVDTAGIRRKSKSKPGLEKLSITKSLDTIKDCDVAVLLLEADKGIESIDKRLAQIVSREHKGLIIVVNKWDLIEEKGSNTMKEFEEHIRIQFRSFSYAPVLFISAKTGKHTQKVLALAKTIFAQRKVKISPDELMQIIEQNPYKVAKPSRAQGKRYPKLLSMRQIGINPPTFQIIVRSKDTIAPGYLRTIEKALRSKYLFIGTPIIFKISHSSSQ